MAWAIVGTALFGMLWFGVFAPKMHGVQTTIGQGDYHLTTTTGAPFAAETLAGVPAAVFFGYTHCPDVCPTTLGDIATWQQELGDQAGAFRFFFVTVDPERDTAPILGDYLSWAKDVTGVTGPRPEIDKALAAFRIYARKSPGTGAEYGMDHTASVLLFDAGGHFSGKIGYQEALETVMPKLRALIGPRS
ncbi:MAG TPA: SCO family protein [Paenirhodobacter sp.]